MKSNGLLTTERLQMRPPVLGDTPFIRALICDPKVRRFLGGPVPAAHLDAAVSSHLEETPNAALWIVEIRETLSPIGLISIADHHDGVEKKISFQFVQASWGMGFATEATIHILDHVTCTVEISGLIAETQVANHASRRLLTRLGMEERCRVQRFGAEQIIYASKNGGN